MAEALPHDQSQAQGPSKSVIPKRQWLHMDVIYVSNIGMNQTVYSGVR